VVIGLGLLTRYTMLLIYPVLLALAFLGRLSWSVFTVIVLVSLSLFALWLIYAYRLKILHVQIDHLLIYSGWKPGYFSPQPQSKGIFDKPGITRSWRMRLRLDLG
jgi:hypothetical protein